MQPAVFDSLDLRSVGVLGLPVLGLPVLGLAVDERVVQRSARTGRVSGLGCHATSSIALPDSVRARVHEHGMACEMVHGMPGTAPEMERETRLGRANRLEP